MLCILEMIRCIHHIDFTIHCKKTKLFLKTRGRAIAEGPRAEMSLTAAQLYEKSHSRTYRLTKVIEGHREWRCSIGYTHFLLVMVFFALHCFHDITTSRCAWMIATFRSPSISLRQLNNKPFALDDSRANIFWLMLHFPRFTKVSNTKRTVTSGLAFDRHSLRYNHLSLPP